MHNCDDTVNGGAEAIADVHHSRAGTNESECARGAAKEGRSASHPEGAAEQGDKRKGRGAREMAETGVGENGFPAAKAEHGPCVWDFQH